MALHPWRKGPFCIQGVHIDTEWRSDLKWDRLAGAIAPLAGRLVLDVGCGNGYHGWRMLGAGARLVMGIDPTLLFVLQWMAINRYLGRNDLAVLPLGIEDLPDDLGGFDTVFSMGVLYHRRSPIDHLMDLHRLLRPGGELVLETLVLEGEGERAAGSAGTLCRHAQCLVHPDGRCARGLAAVAADSRDPCRRRHAHRPAGAALDRVDALPVVARSFGSE
jgi:tRNA (mo5U34)-methyltransferase